MSEFEPGDPQWADDALAQRVRDSLQTHLGPGAEPSADELIPADVAQRLHARLAVETAAPDDGESAPVTTLPVGTRRRIAPGQWYAAAAAVVLLVGGTTFVVANHHDSSTSSPSASSAGEPKAAVPDTANAKKLAANKVTRSQATLTSPGDLDSHVRALLSGADVPSAAKATGSTTSADSLIQSVAGGLTGCLANIDPDRTPLAVDESTYLGKDSLLVVYPGANAKQAEVYVVGSTCAAGIQRYQVVSLP